MTYLIKRNLLLYFRDKASVFFSLMGVFVIIGLYLLFLGDVMRSSFHEIEDSGFLVDSWIMSGVIGVTPITTILAALGNMVEDRRRNIYKDFSASPIKRGTLAGGYIISSYIIGLIMTVITIILAEVYIIVNGGEVLPIINLIKIMGIIMAYSLWVTFTLYFFVSFLRSMNAYSAVATITGTLIGFLTGVYIPIGSLPSAIQTVIKIFPPSQAAMLIRQIMMEPAEVSAFQNIPPTYVEEFKLILGVIFKFGEREVTVWMTMLYLAVTGIIFFLLSLWKMSKKSS